ncbi:MAG: hypothetical protein A2284_12780 [Deltaproteobacteria bacterium RIFOXYA12_FULL_61_11]|nr:MAG: hypothetical protein A2284_12780 [Deltaproteobacteria bacterium RIFOXYA12_FULL_61_11]
MLIAVHGGPFHADDCFSCALLTLLHPEAELARGLPETELATAEIVVDTGLVYDPDHHRFDHHQRGFAESRSNGVPFSAFGLLWRHRGADFVTRFRRLPAGVLSTEAFESELMRAVDKRLVEPVDAVDNGWFYIGVRKAYQGHGLVPYDLFDVLDAFRPIDDSEVALSWAFSKAVALCREILLGTLLRCEREVLASQVVAGELGRARAEGRLYLELPGSLPFREYLLDLEEGLTPPFSTLELAEYSPSVLFVLYPKAREGKTQWYVEALPHSRERFENRRSLPEPWGGRSGEELAKVSGVAGAAFCHRNLFLCAARTREDALALLGKALGSRTVEGPQARRKEGYDSSTML